MEVGNGTIFLVVLAVELLKNADESVKQKCEVERRKSLAYMPIDC